MIYNKLIRDQIPEIIAAKGQTSKTHIASDEEYWTKLKEKLTEEVAEFAKDESIDELADVMDVIAAIQSYKKFDSQAVEALRIKKRQERGGFDKRIILEES